MAPLRETHSELPMVLQLLYLWVAGCLETNGLRAQPASIFYQDGNEWYETSNQDVTYPSEYVIPPRTTSNDSIYAYVRPNIIREDLVLRIFLIGKIEDSTYDRIVGMIEYIIEDNQLVGINTIE